MILYILAYLGGAFTIVSPCILPVLPFVFARADRPFLTSGLPMLLGMALMFVAVAMLATVGGVGPFRPTSMVGTSRWGCWRCSGSRCCFRDSPIA